LERNSGALNFFCSGYSLQVSRQKKVLDENENPIFDGRLSAAIPAIISFFRTSKKLSHPLVNIAPFFFSTTDNRQLFHW